MRQYPKPSSIAFNLQAVPDAFFPKHCICISSPEQTSLPCGHWFASAVQIIPLFPRVSPHGRPAKNLSRLGPNPPRRVPQPYLCAHHSFTTVLEPSVVRRSWWTPDMVGRSMNRGLRAGVCRMAGPDSGATRWDSVACLLGSSSPFAM